MRYKHPNFFDIFCTTVAVLFILFVLFYPIVARADSGVYSVTYIGQAKIDLNLKVPEKLASYGFSVEANEESSTRSFGVGYRVSEWLAVEGSYNDLGSYSACARHFLLSNPIVCANAEVESYSVGALLFFGPVYGRVDYHKATADVWYLGTHKRHKEDGATYGYGIRAAITDKIYLRIEARQPSIPKLNVGLEVGF